MPADPTKKAVPVAAGNGVKVTVAPRKSVEASIVVNGVKVILRDNVAEGPDYPTAPELWPTVAHAPTVLAFHRSAVSFFDMNEQERRDKFARMAKDLTALGKGARVLNGKVVQMDKDANGWPARSIAYADAVMMGERATRRIGMLQTGEGASSCGMFVRTLLKMIGVPLDSLWKEYVDGTVFNEEVSASHLAPGIRVDPSDSETDMLGDDGKALLNAQGAAIRGLRMPRLGDIVSIDDEGTHGHTFVITGVQSLNSANVTTPTGADTPHRFSIRYSVAQGGQMAAVDKFPDDGGCMATNEGSTVLDAANWMWGARKVRYWIDINKLGGICCVPDPGDAAQKKGVPLIVPDRRVWW